MAIDLAELKDLDPENIGSWPAPIRAAIIALVCVAVLFLGYWFHIKGMLEELEQNEQREITLKQSFEQKQAKAANLEPYKQQMKEMEESFGTMLRQLPSKTEVADLLVDITQTGLASGLEFELFSPGAEVPKEFYAELPIKITVNGDYHQFGNFVSGVASLPRIVTLHSIVIAQKNKTGLLTMEASANTYRYLDADEIAAARAANKKQGKGRKR